MMLRRAKLLSASLLLAVVLILIIFANFFSKFPNYGKEIVSIYFFSQLIVATAFFFLGRKYRCPECGKSMFTKYGLPGPWPSSTCSKCGLDFRGQ